MKIAIRADGNANIGLGHIQRCLTLSSQLKKKGAKVIFVVKEDKIVKEKVKQEGFEVIELEHNLNLDKDLRYIVKTIKENKIDILITDSYEFDEKYLIEVKKNVALLVSIDDLAEIAFPSDILINQNIYAKELSYRSLTAKTEFLLGPEYALLKEEFIQSNSRTFQCAKRRMNEKVKNILTRNGIKVYLDSENVTTHSKLIVVDGRYSIVGSTNWSYYALSKNNETNVLIDSEEVAKEYIKYFEELAVLCK